MIQNNKWMHATVEKNTMLGKILIVKNSVL